MHRIDLNADELSAALLGLAAQNNVSILDSCGVGHLGSHLMIAGVEPVEAREINDRDVNAALAKFEAMLASGHAAVFTISYELGPRLEHIEPRTKSDDPLVHVALYDTLAVHDYDDKKTFLAGNEKKFGAIGKALTGSSFTERKAYGRTDPVSNFSRGEYIEAVEIIKEHIRRGNTYQVNLTQRLTVEMPEELNAETVFARLRRDHPAPFSAFLRRGNSTVVSASPERFFRISDGAISASPIKGTRPRGKSTTEDDALRTELVDSKKDRAENTMIVDLLRNDLGRVCKYGSVAVERLCEIQEHPTLFHLVSTINGRLRDGVKFTDAVRALFPCGSVTGAPKIRTMEIIDELETAPRGLSMGAIGYFIPERGFAGLKPGFDLSVAIRTMTIRGREATFNVGGGITIDSDAKAEYDESILKAKALLAALNSE